MAARSDSAPASARQPTSCGVACPSRKCVPSTMTSTLVTAAPAPRVSTTAASSPIQRVTRERAGRSSASEIAWMRSSSAMTVDDPRAVEVIGRDLHAHPVTRQDADPEAAHLAGDVAEDLVAVVELHPEHGVRQGLGDLALEFDLLFPG